jgi:maltose alpha-D-glucosyltransferase/alpha-amylase
LQSAKDEKNKYTDWYIWTDSNFNKKDSIHGLYPRDGGYISNYYACQPALNYGYNYIPKAGVRKDAYDLGEDWKMHYTDERLKPLREEILKIMRFWLKKGVDGFRVDLANSLVKGCVYDSDRDEDVEGLKWLWNILIGTIKAEYPDAAFIAEWVYPSNSVGKCGFDLDYLAHDRPEYNDLFRKEKGTNILPAFECGKTYFSAEGQGTIENFLAYTERLYKEVQGKGYFSVPSGYHDIVRLAEKKDEELLKVVFAFLLTYKHVPFIYYGDEIGMTHAWGINKDGGYIRTGARTPMQWTNGKNRGFSETNGELYLPVNDVATQCVEEQQSREDSLFNTIKKLIKIRNENTALNADGDLKIVRSENNGYPLVYERSDDKNTFIIAINPSACESSLRLDGKVVLSQNSCVDNGIVKLMGKSFVILQR